MRTLCLLFLLASCAQGTLATPAPTATGNTCEPTYLLLDTQPRLNLYRANSFGRTLIGGADLPSGFGLVQGIAIKDARVLIESVKATPLSYRIDSIDFSSAAVTRLREAEGAPPRLSLLAGDRLVVSQPGSTVVTPITEWRPTPLGPPSSLAVDARGNSLLYVMGEHPRYTSYRIESDSGSTGVTISGTDVNVDPSARLDLAQPAVFFMRPRSPEVTTLWRAEAQMVGPVADLPGTHLGFGLSERYVAFVGRNGENVAVEVVGGPLVRKRIYLARATPDQASVLFAGVPFAVSLRLGDTWRTYLVNASRDRVVDAGSGRAIGATFTCAES